MSPIRRSEIRKINASQSTAMAFADRLFALDSQKPNLLTSLEENRRYQFQDSDHGDHIPALSATFVPRKAGYRQS